MHLPHEKLVMPHLQDKHVCLYSIFLLVCSVHVVLREVVVVALTVATQQVSYQKLKCLKLVLTATNTCSVLSVVSNVEVQKMVTLKKLSLAEKTTDILKTHCFDDSLT